VRVMGEGRPESGESRVVMCDVRGGWMESEEKDTQIPRLLSDVIDIINV
jgi:hypothetical protein